MNKASYTEQRIDEELRSHIEDMVDDLVLQGVDRAQARKQALAAFGDMEQIKRDTLQYASSNVGLFTRLSTAQLLFTIYVICFLILIILWGTIGHSLYGARLEPVLLWWVFIGITGLITLLVHWMQEYYGLQERAFLTPIIFVLLASLSLTNILDIDNFEVNVHAVLLGALFFIALNIFWGKISIRFKQYLLYGFSILTTWATLAEQPLFNFLSYWFGQSRCLFIMPSPVPLHGELAKCQQVTWTNVPLLSLYTLLLVGVPVILFFLAKYWTNSATRLWRKCVMTLACLALPLAPFAVNGINQFGALDVIPWKAGIYASYEEILGRDPEPKDLEFYAMTRSYLHMDRVREQLYISEERRIKIDLITQEVLHRHATPEEIQYFVDHRQSVQQIYDELRQQKN